MILGAHNAHLIAVDRAAGAADPGLSIVGGPGLNRWKGDAQAYVDEDQTEVVRGGQRVSIVQTIIDLPANFPVVPEENDVVTLVRTAGVLAGTTETFRVRMIDGGLLFVGKLRIICRAD